MSKYKARGAYHYREFELWTTYREHVVDLVEKIEKHLPKELLLPTIADVGCGEGLIMSRLRGCKVVGCEIDPWAVKLGLAKKNNIRKGSIEVFAGLKFDAVLICDVLEHCKDPIAMLAAARELAPMVVLAVPDRPDRHAVRQVSPLDLDTYMPGWKRVHFSTRHARHLAIYKHD